MPFDTSRGALVSPLEASCGVQSRFRRSKLWSRFSGLRPTSWFPKCRISVTKCFSFYMPLVVPRWLGGLSGGAGHVLRSFPEQVFLGFRNHPTGCGSQAGRGELGLWPVTTVFQGDSYRCRNRGCVLSFACPAGSMPPRWAATGPIPSGGFEMARSTVEQRALALLNTFERAGKAVSRVTVEGKRIELVLVSEQDSDEFDRIDMRHGKA